MRCRRIGTDPSMPVTSAACFGDDQGASGDIPGPEMLFPYPHRRAGGDVAQVERRRAEPAHSPGTTEERREHRDEIGDRLWTS